MRTNTFRTSLFALCTFVGRVIAVNKAGEGEASNTVMAVL